MVPIDTRDAVSWLLSDGARTVNVSIDTPRVPAAASWVPTTADDGIGWSWSGLRDGTDAPTGSVELRPFPTRDLAEVALLALALAVAVTAISAFLCIRRRRMSSMLLAGAAVLPLFLGLVLFSPVLAFASLGTAGVIPPGWSAMAGYVQLLWVLTGPVAATILTVNAVFLLRVRIQGEQSD